MKMTARFSMILFSSDPRFIEPAVAAGVDEIIVDWECRGKEGRQSFADTQINRGTLDDLRRVRECTGVPVVCRLNQYSRETAREVEETVGAGVDEVLLPMVRTVKEVEALLNLVGGRCRAAIMVETMAAVRAAEKLADLPLSRVYVGLNDLAIERNTPNIFEAVADGTVERLRRQFRVPFGFGGLTLPDRGKPIPCRLLIGEMARLGCQFSFLRRSFCADMRGRELSREVPRIRDALQAAFQRSPEVVARERAELGRAIASWDKAWEYSR